MVADQDEIWNNIIDELNKDENFTTDNKYGFAVQSLNLNKDYITQQIKDKKFADLRFPGENGEELFYNNLDFILPYILRQDKEGIY